MTTLELADIIGIISFALSGFLIAIHYKLDILGVFISAFLTALGGGVIRDAIAGRTPYIFNHDLPIILVVATVLIALVFKLHKISNLEGKTAFILLDAIGLSSFAITGSLVAIESEFNFLGIVILAFLTAVGGGTTRDILINKIPFILVSEFYATVAMSIGVIIYILNAYNQISLFNLTIVFVAGTVFRLLAFYRKWNLPKL
ncbi:trimeric intracellular cation channel family protein [Poseidonibacter lekithochrous]|uniref:trimeric intracellular cation channel family protein n=1 Tax=Poseidonibacter lekithochrous TaxID=1904463 RepID=UPI0008FCD06E|nr:TRIC cation channel family protein [Poseidonibacter lekithochrous]QKJ23503.1 UPF0126 domain-containing membrane protein [Poseidonibacter lekithochrous]